MVSALRKELEIRKSEGRDNLVETIYFGGGTPSVLETHEIESVIDTVYRHYRVVSRPEITLEANPDDLSDARIAQLADSRVNRLSIGVQSFCEADLILMNRAHRAEEAEACLERACKYFDNISVDLIYGIPNMTRELWQQNIEKVLSLDIPHISSYALTVEPKTALARFIAKGTIAPLEEGVAREHFHLLIDILETAGYVHYETSNFGKPGYFSKNNTAYWQGKKYLGIGPSAHSYNGVQRGWNISNNSKYLRAIQAGELPMQVEHLSKNDQYNEYIMTGLRTIWGVSLSKIELEFGSKYRHYAMRQAEKHIAEQLLSLGGDTLLVTKKGKFLADGIAADLFMVNLS